MSRMWDDACKTHFVQEVAMILRDYKQNNFDAKDALEEIIYHFDDKIGDIGTKD